MVASRKRYSWLLMGRGQVQTAQLGARCHRTRNALDKVKYIWNELPRRLGGSGLLDGLVMSMESAAIATKVGSMAASHGYNSRTDLLIRELAGYDRHRDKDIYHARPEIVLLITRKVLASVWPITTSPIAEAAQAFKHLMTGNSTAKLVLTTSHHEIVPTLPRRQNARLSPNGSSLLASNVGGVGRVHNAMLTTLELEGGDCTHVSINDLHRRLVSPTDRQRTLIETSIIHDLVMPGLQLRKRFLGRGKGGNENAAPTSSDEISTASQTVESPEISEKGALEGNNEIRGGDVDEEKGQPALSIRQENLSTRQDNEGHELDDDDPVLRDIPWHVRRVVSLHDDPTLPTLTFRYFLLTILFVAPGAFLSMMSSFRTTYAPYIASNYVGIWLAQVLPAKVIKLPFTKFSFNLNPGPWSVKEHVLVTISAASGATYNLGYTPISMSELYFNNTINPAVCVFFMWSIVWTGYSYAAIARQFLLYDPEYPWFQALCQTSLFETQKKQRESPSPASRRQMIIFFSVLGGITLWQFLPEFVFPMLGSLAFLCWVAPRNATANFIGAGFGGMGFLNLSLDWSNLSNLSGAGSLFLTPFWTQMLIFLGFVINCWILLPAAKWGNLGSWDLHLMSNRLYLKNGTEYPITSLITPDVNLNETMYAELGPPYVGTQQLWNMFFDYGSYPSGLMWVALFGFTQLRSSWLKMKARRQGPKGQTINHQYGDQLNILQRSYKEVPYWWYLALFGCSFISMIVILAKGFLFIPIWTYIIALLTGALVVTPFGWLYAVSNFQLEIGTFNELIYGLMVNAVSGFKNPAGASVYGSVAGDAWYRAQLMLQDQKIGHYMHIPPRAVFFSQVFGSFIGIPINYGVIRWVVKSKAAYLSGAEEDPTHQWTGQSLASSLTTATQYVLIGPNRLFALPLYKVLPYGFLAGAVAPIILYILHLLFPRLKTRLWNTAVLFSALSTFYGNISTGYFSYIVGGFVVMFWAYRYKYELWARYNYILAAAFDAGFNLNMLLIFLFFGAGKIVTMPHCKHDQYRNYALIICKVYIVTGAASGVGFELAKLLYRAGGTVYIAARSTARCDDAIAKIVAEIPDKKGKLGSFVVDLADLRTVKSGVDSFLAKEKRLDVLVHNAGVMTPPAGSKDKLGHDLEIGTNCLGPYLMTLLLEPILVATATLADVPKYTVRIVFVVSLLQVSVPPGAMQFQDDGTPVILTKFMENYMQSKVGGAWLAAYFAKRLGQHGIMSMSLHPGLMRTDLQRHWPLPMRLMMRFFKPSVYGAYSELYAGFSPDVKPEQNGGHLMAWGRRADLPPDIANGLKSKAEGGTGAAQRFFEYCDREIKDYL
ncbi:hypothetical protein B7494_g300 [Chlorociboria aeruginascens]|nr:hypothetical protein B7494_g300 [Chlorociboria aeruginascens]